MKLVGQAVFILLTTVKKHFSEDGFVIYEKLETSLPQKSAKLGTEQVFCHNDLSYNNILLTNNLEVGVIDFGNAGNYDKSLTLSRLKMYYIRCSHISLR